MLHVVNHILIIKNKNRPLLFYNYLFNENKFVQYAV